MYIKAVDDDALPWEPSNAPTQVSVLEYIKKMVGERKEEIDGERFRLKDALDEITNHFHFDFRKAGMKAGLKEAITNEVANAAMAQ